MERLLVQPQMYCYLDAAQLVKHAFGLTYTSPTMPVTLLYLYWESASAVGIIASLSIGQGLIGLRKRCWERILRFLRCSSRSFGALFRHPAAS